MLKSDEFQLENPLAVMPTEYVPAGILENWKEPLSCDGVDCSCLWSGVCKATVAPASVSPLVSVTVPVIIPLSCGVAVSWADKDTPMTNIAKISRQICCDLKQKTPVKIGGTI